MNKRTHNTLGRDTCETYSDDDDHDDEGEEEEAVEKYSDRLKGSPVCTRILDWIDWSVHTHTHTKQYIDLSILFNAYSKTKSVHNKAIQSCIHISCFLIHVYHISIHCILFIFAHCIVFALRIAFVWRSLDRSHRYRPAQIVDWLAGWFCFIHLASISQSGKCTHTHFSIYHFAFRVAPRRAQMCGIYTHTHTLLPFHRSFVARCNVLQFPFVIHSQICVCIYFCFELICSNYSIYTVCVLVWFYSQQSSKQAMRQANLLSFVFLVASLFAYIHVCVCVSYECITVILISHCLWAQAPQRTRSRSFV